MNELPAIAVAIGSLCGCAIAILTFWMKFSDRVSKAETAAQNANIAVTACRLEIDQLQDELVEHRVAVAREYVSKDTLATLESRVIDAINSLGQRLDNLFKNR